MEPLKALNLQRQSSAKRAMLREFPFQVPRHYRATVIKTVWHQHKSGYLDQWNKVEDLNLSQCTYSHLLYDKDAKRHALGKDTTFKKTVQGKLGVHMEETAIRSVSMILYKNQLKKDKKSYRETHNPGTARRKHSNVLHGIND